MRTILQVLTEADPRKPLCDRLGISEQYACDIIKGRARGGARALTRIAKELGLSDAEFAASMRELFTPKDTDPTHSDAPTSDAS